MPEPGSSCVERASGPVATAADPAATAHEPEQEVSFMRAAVGKPAPDFEATAFVGPGFKNIKLSDYSGKWVALCFYPGDFTFV